MRKQEHSVLKRHAQKIADKKEMQALSLLNFVQSVLEPQAPTTSVGICEWRVRGRANTLWKTDFKNASHYRKK